MQKLEMEIFFCYNFSEIFVIPEHINTQPGVGTIWRRWKKEDLMPRH